MFAKQTPPFIAGPGRFVADVTLAIRNSVTFAIINLTASYPSGADTIPRRES